MVVSLALSSSSSTTVARWSTTFFVLRRGAISAVDWAILPDDLLDSEASLPCREELFEYVLGCEEAYDEDLFFSYIGCNK